ELYDHTARAIKAVNPRLRVGGPATAAADWVDVFLDHLAKEDVPIDFVSSHGYADDTVQNLFHNDDEIPMSQRVCRAIRKIHDQIAASRHPQLPLMWTEWNVPSYGELHARDKSYVGAALADDIRQCDGLVDIMSFWTFDDVFEEGGVVKEPFYGGFGLIAAGGIKKPSFYSFALLHKLGEERIRNSDPNLLLTRRKDGTVVLALWNLVDLDSGGGDTEAFRLKFSSLGSGRCAHISRVDEKHGNALAAYEMVGKPRYPTRAQVQDMNRATQLSAPQIVSIPKGELSLTIPVNGLALVEIPSRPCGKQ